jgi:hypothetical protein
LFQGFILSDGLPQTLRAGTQLRNLLRFTFKISPNLTKIQYPQAFADFDRRFISADPPEIYKDFAKYLRELSMILIVNA